MITAQLVALQTATADACGTSPSYLCELVYDWTGNERLAETSDLMLRPIKALLIFFFAWIINRILKRIVARTFERIAQSHEQKEAVEVDEPEGLELGPFEALRTLANKRTLRLAEQVERGRQRAQTIGTVLRSLVGIVVYTIATLMALGEFDVNLGPLIASAGIVGIALGFGAQSLVRDFLSGIFMFVEDQYGVGDIVDVGEASGVVEEVKLRITKVRDVNGALWHIPNGEIRRVANKSQEWARAVLDVDVAYDTDLDHATAVIKRVADEMWQEYLPEATILEEPLVLGVERFAADSIALRLAVKVEPAEQFNTARELRRRLKDAFDAEGIEIPFPQRTVWMHQVPAASPAGRPGRPAASQDAEEGEAGS